MQCSPPRHGATHSPATTHTKPLAVAAPARPETRPAGFTLVEVLVSVMIVGILVALLFPAANRMRNAGARAKGTANLRQVGLAVLQFANDNQNRLPGPSTLGIVPYYSKKGSGTSYLFGAKIAPYFDLPDSGPDRADLIDVPVFQDPGFKAAVRNPPLNTPVFIQNSILSDQPSVTGNISIFGSQSATPDQQPLTLAEVANIGGLSKVWALTTADQMLPSSITRKSGWVGNLPKMPPYGHVRLRLFVDAHVEAVPLDAPLL